MLRNILVGVVVALAVGCGVTGQSQQGLGSGQYARDEVPACGATTTDLFVGESTEVGLVTVSNTAEHLDVNVAVAPPWVLAQVQVYVGPGPMPTDASGLPAPSLFTHVSAFTAYQSGYGVRFALREVGGGCGVPLTVAVHAEVVRVVEGELEQDALAWGFGTPFDEHRSGYAFTHTVCCPADPGCTRSQGYWKTHHAGARVPALDRDWPLAETTQLCGKTWLELLGTPPRGGDAWVILAHQYIAARLNVAAGASVPAAVDAALTDADAFLLACAVEDADRAEALEVAETLDDFNNGLVGPGHCE